MWKSANESNVFTCNQNTACKGLFTRDVFKPVSVILFIVMTITDRKRVCHPFCISSTPSPLAHCYTLMMVTMDTSQKKVTCKQISKLMGPPLHGYSNCNKFLALKQRWPIKASSLILEAFRRGSKISCLSFSETKKKIAKEFILF